MTTSWATSNRFPGVAKIAATAGLWCALGPACRPAGIAGPAWRAAPAPSLATPVPDAAAGAVLDRRFEDASYPFGLTLTEGWVAQPGASDGALRLALDHVPTGATLEVRVLHSASTAPRPRDGCTWSFQDSGAYGALHATEARDVATCTPDDPDAPLVLSWILVREALAYHLELAVPPGRLLQARRAARGLLDGVRIY
ncbi:MAG: hypothetical protein ABIO70_33480 [Pseudomonadota bacterium]